MQHEVVIEWTVCSSVLSELLTGCNAAAHCKMWNVYARRKDTIPIEPQPYLMLDSSIRFSSGSYT